MASPSRIVVVVGAGASRELGVGGQIPLMTDWSKALIERIDHEEPDLAKAMGLVEDLEAEQFEEILGAFIQWHRMAMPLVDRFKGMGGVRPGSWQSEVPGWIDGANRRAEVVVEALRDSLFQNFGRQVIDAVKAEAAYRRLIEVFGTDSSFAFATTNYDPAIEIALLQMNLDPNDGFRRKSNWDTPTLDTSRLIEWGSRHNNRVPVLHLHGAVGWYQRADGTIAQQPPDQAYNPTLGTPVFLPPDPAKDPSNDATVSMIWEQFEEALRGATHLLVLGHSLRDDPLVRAIESQAPQAQKGVFTPNATEVSTCLGEATAIEGEFAPRFGRTGLKNWIQGIVEPTTRSDGTSEVGSPK